MNAPLTLAPSVCPHDCTSTCALEVEILDARTIGRVRGSQRNAYTGGVICEKVARYAERVHHPERLTHPLLRNGPKGANHWKRISWDEALTRVAKHMKADRDANFIEKNEKGVTVNRWNTTGLLVSSASANESGYVTVKMARALGMVALDTQARI